MYRVAIIDDNSMDRNLIEAISDEYFRQKDYEYEIKTFTERGARRLFLVWSE